MTQKLGGPLDCGQYELREPLFEQLGSMPSSPMNGQFWFITGTSVPQYYSTAYGVRPMDAKFLHDGSIANDALTTNPLDRGNHFNTQVAATIRDLAATVQAYPVSAFAPATAPLNLGGQRATNAAQATSDTDLGQWGQVKAYVQASVQGQTAVKLPAQYYAAGNVNISSPGTSTFDGGTATAGVSRVLLANQTTNTQNNVYVFNGPTSPMTVATDANTGSQWIEGSEILIAEGTTYGGAIFRQTTAGNISLGTTPLQFTQTFKINAYLADNLTTQLTGGFTFSVKYAYGLTTVNGSLEVDKTKIASQFRGTLTCDGTNKNFNVTHGLGVSNVEVFLRDASGNKVWADDNPVNSSTVTISFGSVYPNGTQFAMFIIG